MIAESRVPVNKPMPLSGLTKMENKHTKIMPQKLLCSHYRQSRLISPAYCIKAINFAKPSQMLRNNFLGTQ